MSKKAHETALPKLRFPEFRDAGEWEKKQVKELFDSENKSEKGGLFDNERIITVRLHGLGVVKNDRAAALTGGTNYFKREAGQFIFSKIDLLNGAFGLVPDKLHDFVSSSDIPALTFRNQESAGFFLNWMLASYKNLVLERTGTSSTLKRVSKNGFLNSAIWLPSVREQQKIAATLSSLDNLLTAQSAKLKALQAHKRGLMQDLFPAKGETVPKQRFPEFRDAGEWVETTIGDVCKAFSGGTPSTSQKKYYGSGIPFIRSAEIDKEKTELFLTEEGLANSSAKLVEKGDILFALYGANSGDVAISKQKGAINQAILCLRSKASNVFIFHFLTYRKDWIIKKYLQGGQGNLSGEIVKSVVISFPLLAEQQKIADCLSALDNLITAQSQKIDALKLHKKGLMQALFPMASEQEA